MTAEVQWYQSSGSGRRSSKLYGISRVHLWGGDPTRSERVTVCGRALPSRSRWITPDDSDPRCQRCRGSVMKHGSAA